MASLREEMNDLFSNLLTDGGASWLGGPPMPPLNVSETDNEIEVRLDVPGIPANDLDIQLVDNHLTISGARNEEREEKGRTYHRVERLVGSFSRSVLLPCRVKEDSVDAQYKNGVLKVTMQKTEEAKAHKIKIKT
jgi:HSP20 family protein